MDSCLHADEELEFWGFVKMRQAILTSFIAAAVLACSQTASDSGGERGTAADGGVAVADRARPCTPLETREPNASGQQPAFAGQTRICGESTGVAFDVQTIASGLEHPWAVEPLPDGSVIVTERPGRMRIIRSSGVIGDPIAGLPRVFAQGQGGLLDVALGSEFSKDRMIYWSYSEPRDGGNATSVARGVLARDGRSIQNAQVIFRAQPAYDGSMHFGSRLAFGPDGMLFVTLGERSDRVMRPHAQRLDSHMGKIIRIHPDGRVPQDNPFVGREGALPEIWTLGHRNVQAATFDEQGRLWIVDHGARGGDEVNLVEKGKNYGWPVITYGEEYSGRAVSDATQKAGLEQPVYYWDPVIAPSGLEYYTGNAFPQWKGSLFIGGLASQRLVRLSLDGTRVSGEEHLLADRGQRIRDVRQASDGTLYIVTDEDEGEVLRLVPGS